MFYGHYPSFCGKVHIKNLNNFNAYGYSWDVVDEYGTRGHYSTDSNGEGLFIYDERDGSETQLLGTCQFQLTQQTDSGRRKYIRKHFEN